MLKDTDVHDRYANYIMRNMDNGINQVIVANPTLEEYIRNNYPNYSIIRSV
jgi:collagenase-like PrtC family protease